MTYLPLPSTGGLSSVHHMRCHFTLAGTNKVTHLPARDREKLALSAAAVCDRKLGQLLANDPGVYLLKHVHLEMGAFLPPEGGFSDLAESLGERLTGAIMLDVVRGGDDVVHFASQAEYVSQFLKDLFAGTAWGHWYYYPFAHHRAASHQETVRGVLSENRDHLPQILAGLQRRGQIDALLNSLDPADVAAWWAAIDAPFDYRETVRPLATAVLSLVSRLDLWKGNPLELPALLAEMEHHQQTIDWRDARSLAATLLSGITALLRLGRLRSPAESRTANLEAALRELDWLDHEWLLDQLRHLSPDYTPPQNGATSDLPLRKSGGPTARQSRLLNDLLTLLDDQSFRQALDSTVPTSAANALRLYARLVDRFPQWQDDPLASTLIKRLLTAWEALVSGRKEQLRRSLQGLGKHGETVARHLAGVAGQTEAAADRLAWPTAGLALLLRAVLDARLPALVHQVVERHREQALQALLAGILLQLSPAAAGEELPPGLVAVCGGYPTTRAELGEALQSLPLPALAQAWLEVLAGQRALDVTALYLFRLSGNEGHEIMVGTNAAGTVLSQAALLPPNAGPELLNRTIANWLAGWQKATAVQPALLASDKTFSAAIKDDPKLQVSLQIIDEGDQEGWQTYQSARARLVETWGVLAPGKVGPPQHDLLLGLMATGLLRLWARWLRNFSDSSIPYLLDNFFYRSGTVIPDEDRLCIELGSGPLDMVLKMAGYFDPLERLSWLTGRGLVFCMR